MTQQQSQSQSSGRQSQGPSSQSQSQSQGIPKDQGSSLSAPASPDPTSPYKGTEQAERTERRPDHVADDKGRESMEQPYFSEVQSILSANGPVERPGDHFAEPEDPLPATLATQPTEQAVAQDPRAASGAAFETSAGTVHAGMTVVDSYGHAMGVVSSVDGERLRLASTDPHDDGVTFLAISLIDAIDGDRILLSGRGDASFGMPGE